MAFPEPAASLREVSCHGDGGHGLNRFSLAIGPGTVHALVGEADSGRDCVRRIFAGELRDFSGEAMVAGGPICRAAGVLRRLVRVVERQAALVDRASLAEHFTFIAAERQGHWRLNRRRVRDEATAFLAGIGAGFDLALPAGELRAADRLIAEILLASYAGPALLILDNSLAEMALAHKKEALRIVGVMAGRGMSTLLITPLFDDVMDYSDDVTMIREGECVLSASAGGLDKLAVLKAAYAQAASEPGKGGDEPDIFRRHMSYYVSLLTNFPKPFIIVNLRMEIELMNQAAREFFGLQGPPPRLDLGEMLGGFFAADAAELTGRIRDNPQYSRTGLTLFLKGQRRIVNLFSYRVNEGGTDIGSIILVDDVTEHAHLQEQMLLAEKVASLGILTAGMAHEINHPLSIINNIAEYLRMRFDDPELVREIGEIQAEVGNITGIIRNLADFSYAGYVEKVDMHALIRNLVGLVSHFVGAKRIALELDLCDEDFILEAGRVEMRQVLLNILSNAITSIAGTGRIRISTRIRDGMAVLQIADNGCGMSRETMNGIFLPFYSRQSGRGMGLGLYIAYNIMETYGGKIGVESEVGRGSTFTLEFGLS